MNNVERHYQIKRMRGAVGLRHSAGGGEAMIREKLFPKKRNEYCHRHTISCDHETVYDNLITKDLR
jgi:hypothetical protein